MPTRKRPLDIIALDEQLLEKLDNKWFRAVLMQLVRIEIQWGEFWEMEIDKMPDWAEKASKPLFKDFRNQFGPLDSSKIISISTEDFAKLLGAKMRFSKGLQSFYTKWIGSDNATKAKLSKLVGGSEGIEFFKRLQPICKKLDRISKKVFRQVNTLPLNEQGYFWRGYGSGFLFCEALRDWKKTVSSTKAKNSYMRGYISLNWEEIELQRKQGGWPEILQNFQSALPEGVDISEDAFQQILKRAGFKNVGRVGRPSKSGQKTLRVS